jgi:hypothetical protein
MKSAFSPVNRYHVKGKGIAFVLLLAFFLMPVAWPQVARPRVVCEGRTPQAGHLNSVWPQSYSAPQSGLMHF